MLADKSTQDTNTKKKDYFFIGRTQSFNKAGKKLYNLKSAFRRTVVNEDYVVEELFTENNEPGQGGGHKVFGIAQRQPNSPLFDYLDVEYGCKGILEVKKIGPQEEQHLYSDACDGNKTKVLSIWRKEKFYIKSTHETKTESTLTQHFLTETSAQEYFKYLIEMK